MSRKVIPFKSIQDLRPKGKGWKGSKEIQKIQAKLENFKSVSPQPSKPPNQASLELYKQFQQAINQFPIKSYHSKLKFNVRELFDLYKDCPESQIQELVEGGKQDLQILKSLCKLEKQDLDLLFKKESNRNESTNAE